jgi:hypothetical protein
MGSIRHFRELDVYKMAMEAALSIFELTKRFPAEEKYSMIDQVRRSSRSVCANTAEAWRKRRYAAFVSRLSDAETEARRHRSGWKWPFAAATDATAAAGLEQSTSTSWASWLP